MTYPFHKDLRNLDLHPPKSHTHIESEITDLDKYTQAEVDALLDTKASSSALTAHENDTTNIHGIVDTSDLGLKSGNVNQFNDITSSGVDIEDAVTKKHTQGTDQKLDEGGVNEVTVAELKNSIGTSHTQNTDIQIEDALGSKVTFDNNLDTPQLRFTDKAGFQFGIRKGTDNGDKKVWKLLLGEGADEVDIYYNVGEGDFGIDNEFHVNDELVVTGGIMADSDESEMYLYNSNIEAHSQGAYIILESDDYVNMPKDVVFQSNLQNTARDVSVTIDELGDAVTKKHNTHDASNVDFTPGSGTSFSSAVDKVDEALDDLDSRIGGSGLDNVVEDTTPELGGEMDCGENSIGFSEKANVVVTNAVTIDWKESNKQLLTVDDDVTISFTAPSNPCSLTLRIVQSGAGNTTTLPTTKTPEGEGITLSNGNGDIDIVSIYYDGTDYYAIGSLKFS